MKPTIDQVLQRGKALMTKILAQPDEATGADFNDLFAQFGLGFPIEALGNLLQHPNKRVVDGSLFIAEELGIKAVGVLDEIIAQVRHRDADIRWSAFEALDSCSSGEYENAFVHVVIGMQDVNPGCRKLAMLFMIRGPSTRLRAALQVLESSKVEVKIQNGLRMLLGECAQDAAKIELWMQDADPLVRKIGLVAAARIANEHPHLLESAVLSNDPDIHFCASAQLRFIQIERKYQERRSREQENRTAPSFDSK